MGPHPRPRPRRRWPLAPHLTRACQPEPASPHLGSPPSAFLEPPDQGPAASPPPSHHIFRPGLLKLLAVSGLPPPAPGLPLLAPLGHRPPQRAPTTHPSHPRRTAGPVSSHSAEARGASTAATPTRTPARLPAPGSPHRAAVPTAHSLHLRQTAGPASSHPAEARGTLTVTAPTRTLASHPAPRGRRTAPQSGQFSPLP